MMRPVHPGCKDHKFCPRSQPIRVRAIEENYPLFNERRDMERKMAPKYEEEDPITLPDHVRQVIKRPNVLVDFLRKDFPYRGITQKKAAKRNEPSMAFEDDRVERYAPTEE